MGSSETFIVKGAKGFGKSLVCHGFRWYSKGMGAFLSDSISDALATWERGGLVAMPTETVYGLAAPIDEIELVKTIFSFKERPFFDPLIIHVASLEEAKNCSVGWSEVHENLAKIFWPGPLTIVIEKASHINPLITSGLETVGIRFPNHVLAQKLIQERGCPLAAPSANKFTKTSPTHQEHVLENFKDEDVCVLKSPPAMGGIESTIIRVDGDTLHILRPGLITEVDLQKIAKKFSLQIKRGESAFEEKAKIEAPGQHHIHYRPDFPFHILEEGSMESSRLQSFEVIPLDRNPLVTARDLYWRMQSSLASQYKGRVFLLPKARKELSEKERELWQSIENRLKKAATPFS